MSPHPDRTGPDTAVGAALRGLVRSFSVEITPREAAARPPLADLLAPDTPVYLTHLARDGWEPTVAATAWVRGLGLRPVPHLAARAVPDRAALAQMLAAVAAAGATDLLLVAGSTAPVGEFTDTAQVLATGLLEQAGIRGVGLAGHPEGHPDVDDAELDAALLTKAGLAAALGLSAHVVTQFGFAAEPVVAWERRLRGAGLDLDVHVGLPGLTSPVRLLRFGLSCGVGPSLSVLRQRTGGVLRLATTPVHHPDELLLGLAAATVADPASRFADVHFFPFGAVAATAAWASDIRAGRFAVNDRARLRVPA